MGRSLSTAALYGLVDEVAECLGEPVDSLAHVRRVRLLQDALVGRIKLLVISLMSTRITRRDLPRSPRVQGLVCPADRALSMQSLRFAYSTT